MIRLRLLALLAALLGCVVPAQAAISLVNTLGTATTGAIDTTVSLTTVNAVTAGNSIIVFVGTNNGTDNVTCSDPVNGLYNTNLVDGSLRTAICAKHNALALPSGSLITVSVSPFPTNIAVSAAEFAGLATVSPILDRAGVLSGISTSPSVTTGAATSQADELVVGVINANSLGAPRIFTPGTNGTGNNCANTGSQTLGTLPSAQSAAPFIFPVYCIVSATGIYRAAGTLDGTESWSAVITAYRGNTAATHFAVTAPASAGAGTASSFTVTALDQFNHTATSYGGSVHFTSSDGAATLPADSTLTNGVGTFPATLRTIGNQTLTATDTVDSSITGTSNVVAVSAATSFSGPSATGSGTITASFTGGGAGCTFATARFIPLTGDPASPPAGTAPSKVAFPHGLFDFTTTGCTPGSTITMTITYPSTLPAGTQYWKYGPRPGPIAAGWYVLPATVGGATVTFSITDGLLGDDDLLANGDIVDQGGPGAGSGSSVPTLSQWMLMLLAVLMLGLAMRRSRGLMP